MCDDATRIECNLITVHGINGKNFLTERCRHRRRHCDVSVWREPAVAVIHLVMQYSSISVQQD